MQKIVCLGFISCEKNTDNTKVITNEYIVDPTALYEIDIAGRRFAVKPHLHPLSIVQLNNLDKKYTPTPVRLEKI